jgi:hypothetical protein
MEASETMRAVKNTIAALGLIGAAAVSAPAPASAQVYFGVPGVSIGIGTPYYGYPAYPYWRHYYYPGYRPYWGHRRYWGHRHYGWYGRPYLGWAYGFAGRPHYWTHGFYRRPYAFRHYGFYRHPHVFRPYGLYGPRFGGFRHYGFHRGFVGRPFYGRAFGPRFRHF